MKMILVLIMMMSSVLKAQNADNIWKIDNHASVKIFSNNGVFFSSGMATTSSISDCTDYSVGCNDVSATEYGLQFIGSCPHSDAQAIKGNIFTGNDYDLVLNGVTNFADIGTSGVASGNNFPNTSIANLYTMNITNGALYKYFYYGSEPHLTLAELGSTPIQTIGPLSQKLSPCPLKFANPNDNDYQSYNFLVYPNPTTSAIQILTDHVSNQKAYQLTISDVAGKILTKINPDPASSEIKADCKNFPAGIYFVTLLEDDHAIWTTKIIKIQ